MIFRFLFSIFVVVFTLNSCFYEENKIIEARYSSNKNYEDEILKKLLGMSLDEKIGQLFIVGFDGAYSLTENDIYILKNLKVGGLIFFGKNILDSNQAVELVNQIKNLNRENENIPLFLSIDQEGGIVTRLPNEIIKFEKAREIGNKNDVNYAYESARIMGEILYRMGFNMNFAPVLDIYTNSNNKVIGSRAFSSDKKIVADMAIETIKGLGDSGIISVGKHYPGHGDTNEDSHYELPVLEHDYERIENVELYPFKAAIENGIDGILVSHLLYKNIDEKIATLSNKFLYEILRKELGFRGISITDDMIMQGLTNTNSIPEASVEALKAGIDIILIGSGYENIFSSIEVVKKAVENGEINQDEIDRKVYNILRIKSKYNLNNDEISKINVNEINEEIRRLLNR